MVPYVSRVTASIVVLLAFLIITPESQICPSDVDLVEFNLNLEYLEAEFFLFGALGHGLDVAAPGLAEGGPTPIGARLANLGTLVRDIITQFGFQEVGHGHKEHSERVPKAFVNLSMEEIARRFDTAFGRCPVPPFDPYANDINFLIASYARPYIGLTSYVGVIPLLQNATFKELVAGLSEIVAGQDAVIRTLLYERRTLTVDPYGVTLKEFSDQISMIRDTLGNISLIKDEGLVVPIEKGAEGRVTGNILAGNNDSLAYSRTPQEVLRILYFTSNESLPGGLFPNGASGRIATSYLCTT